MLHTTRVTLVAHISTTDSGGAAFLATASDGNNYWVKAPNNPQGARTLVPERVVSRIGELIGAPVRPVALVEIPPGFEALSYRPGYRLTPGIAHGSLDLGPSIVVDDWRGLAARDGNRRRAAFLCALWDLCEGNDPQWLSDFDANADAAIWSFDHGLWFAGEADWRVPLTGKSWIHDSVDTASRSALLEAAAAVEGLTLADLQEATGDVPLSWHTSAEELSALAETIYSKIPGVAQRLRAAANTTSHP